MSNMFNGFSSPTRAGQVVRRRRATRLGLESLESRRVLATTIAGTVTTDLNANGAVDVGEPGQAGVEVYIDANANEQLDITGTVIEPDDYANKQPIDGSAIGATFRVADEANVPLANAPTIVSFTDDLASTGQSVFGWTRDANETPFFNSLFRLRVDFATPVSSVKLDFISSIDGRETGVLEAYSADGTLVDSYETADLLKDQFETMHVVRSQGDIAYVTGYTKRFQLTGRLDSLRINGADSENWTLTDADGNYRLHVSGGGTYSVNEIVPEGFQRTLPAGTAGQSVTVTTNTVATGVDFANASQANQPPIAANDEAETNEDVAAVIDILDNDSDDHSLVPGSVVIVTAPSHGTATIDSETGAITYTPTEDFFGSDLIRYTVLDNEGAVSNVATVGLTVISVNDAPVAVADEDSTTTGESVEVDVLNNDTDVDNALDPATVVITSEPAHGTVSINLTTGAITYTPDAAFTGIDSFEYTVCDVDATVSNEAVVTLTVESAGSGWQNADNPLDVDGDGGVFPIDALLIINELNLPQYRDPVTGELPSAPSPVPAFFDVDGDGFASPTDAILVINYLNSPANPNFAVAAEAEGEPMASASETAPAASDVAAATLPKSREMSAESVDSLFADAAAALDVDNEVHACDA